MERGRSIGGTALLAAAVIWFTPAVSHADERGPNPLLAYNALSIAPVQREAKAHDLVNQERYYSAVVTAGRGFARMHPSANQYGRLAVLTVRIGSQLHYDPLTNHDAASWWVKDASQWVSKNSKNPELVRDANALIARVDAMDDNPQALARFADADAMKVVQEHPADREAWRLAVEADWRAWLLTNDPQWRALAAKRAAKANIPDAAIQQAIAYAPPDDISELAPADEYFGRMGYSILGLRNAMRNINQKIDSGEGAGDQESLAMLVADSLLDMQKAYPADRDLPKLLYDGYTMLGRVGTPAATDAATNIRTLLVVEYQDSDQAQQLLSDR